MYTYLEERDGGRRFNRLRGDSFIWTGPGELVNGPTAETVSIAFEAILLFGLPHMALRVGRGRKYPFYSTAMPAIWLIAVHYSRPFVTILRLSRFGDRFIDVGGTGSTSPFRPSHGSIYPITPPYMAVFSRVWRQARAQAHPPAPVANPPAAPRYDYFIPQQWPAAIRPALPGRPSSPRASDRRRTDNRSARCLSSAG